MHLLTIIYLGLNSLLLANELRPQDEDFFLAYFQLFTHWSQLIQEDSIRRGTRSSYLWRSRFCEGLLQLIQLILQFFILRFKFLTLQEIGTMPSPSSIPMCLKTTGTKLWIEMVRTMSNCNKSINLSRIPGLLAMVSIVWEDFTDRANLSSEAQNQNTCTRITQISWEKNYPSFFPLILPLTKKSLQQIVVSRLRRFCIIQWYYKTFLVLVV